MLSSPGPVMSHSEAGLPGLEFSQTTGFTTGSHGPTAVAEGTPSGSTAATKARTKGATRRVKVGRGRLAERPGIGTPARGHVCCGMGPCLPHSPCLPLPSQSQTTIFTSLPGQL